MARSSIYQVVNIGPEVTAGTAVSSGKRLSATMIEPQIKTDIKKYRGSGYKFPAIAAPNKEWVEADLSGPITFTEIIYWLAGAIHDATPTGAGAEKTWTFSPDIDGADTPQTYTVEYGDATRSLEFTYGIVSDLTLTFGRDACELAGKMWGRPISDGITPTASPTALALLPVLPEYIGVKLAGTQAGLGAASDLTSVVSVEWALTERFNPVWFLNSSQDWSGYVEKEPKLTIKLKMERDATGMGMLTYMRAGTTRFMRIEAIGPTISSDPYSLTIDTACKVISDPTIADEDGLDSIEWDMEGFIDTTWGKTTEAVVVNELTAL